MPQKDQQTPDSFGPVTKGSLQMPANVNLHFIGSEADVPLLDKLVGADMIGMDSEWRPTVKPFVE